MSSGSISPDLAAQMSLTARHIFGEALTESNIDRAFQQHISCERGVLRVCEDLYHLDAYDRIFVVSIGKAAHTMLHALLQQTGERVEGVVVSSVEPASQVRNFRYFLGGHPTPNAESVRAAESTLKSLAALGPSSLAIFLISGGGSSMIEEPIDDEISLSDLIATYKSLVLSGAPIGEINAVRKHLSAIKGGRMAAAAYPAQQVSLLVSDVPANTPDALASGPTMPDATSVEDCHAIAAKHRLLEQFPASVRELFERHALEETPKSDDGVFTRSRWWPMLSNQSVLDAASAAASRAGFYVEVDSSCDDWDYARAADYLLQRLRQLRTKSERVCLISGGEVTVRVANGGTGGRNQQFALYCADKIAGERITVLSAGTDGIDGNSTANGAVVDGTTRERAKPWDIGLQLAHFDAFPLFQALGDAIMTGPTGNNLRDLRLLLAY
jgi:glycerate 2-kinase